MNPLIGILFLPLLLIQNTSAEGALPTLMAATDQDVQGGDYFGPAGMAEMRKSAKKVPTVDTSKDEADAAKLWQISEEMSGVNYAL